MDFDPDENPVCRALCGPLLSAGVLVWQSRFDMVRVFSRPLSIEGCLYSGGHHAAGGVLSNALIEELKARGLLAQVSDEAGLAEHLNGGSRTVYCGFDPTADSLHIGNLVPLLTLRRFQAHGHRPISARWRRHGLIGDPSGRTDERSLNQTDVVAEWVENIRRQVEGLVSFEGNNASGDREQPGVDGRVWTSSPSCVMWASIFPLTP